MNKKQLVVVCVAKLLCISIPLILLAGCATINFSANYYTLPPNYTDEVNKSWNELITKLALKFQYSIHVVSDNECTMKGIPEIGVGGEGGYVRMPENFIKYVYQNYYNDRFTILNCISAHEICHVEYDLPMGSTSEDHFKVDQKAIELVGVLNFYKSLFVLRNYWVARKGVGGHVGNSFWMLCQLRLIQLGILDHVTDVFETDLTKRMDYCVHTYGLKGDERSCFRRSRESKLVNKNIKISTSSNYYSVTVYSAKVDNETYKLLIVNKLPNKSSCENAFKLKKNFGTSLAHVSTNCILEEDSENLYRNYFENLPSYNTYLSFVNLGGLETRLIIEGQSPQVVLSIASILEGNLKREGVKDLKLSLVN